MTIERLAPGEIIEMRDPVMGELKLGLVDETGVGYYDVHGEGELPKPIHGEFEPRSLGTISTWFRDLDPTFALGLSKSWAELTRKNLDVLTIARALRAGIEQQLTITELLEEAGKAATQRILEGRKLIGDALPNG